MTLILDVEEDLLNTLIISIFVASGVIVRVLVLLKLFEVFNNPQLGLYYYCFLGSGLTISSLTKSLLSCFHFLLQTHNFATHRGIVELDGLEVVSTFL